MGDLDKEVANILAGKSIELGDQVKDTATGFYGIAVKRQEELGSTAMILVIFPGSEDFYRDELWVPEPRLVKIQGG